MALHSLFLEQLLVLNSQFSRNQGRPQAQSLRRFASDKSDLVLCALNVLSTTPWATHHQENPKYGNILNDTKAQQKHRS